MNQKYSEINAFTLTFTRGRTGHGGRVAISTTDVRPGVGPFCNGQITWEDGPSPGRTVRRAY